MAEVLAVGHRVADVDQRNEVDPEVEAVQDLAVGAGTEAGFVERQVVLALLHAAGRPGTTRRWWG